MKNKLSTCGLVAGPYGVGLILAGAFVTDAGAGFPPGAPAGAPEHASWHGVLHEAGFAVASLSWLAACVVFARRFAGRRTWVRACLAAPAAVLVLVSWPDLDSLSVRLVVATAVQMAFLAALAARSMRGLPAPARRPVPAAAAGR